MRSGQPQLYSNFEANLDYVEPPSTTNKNPSNWDSTRVIYLCTQNNNVKSDCEKPIKIIYEKKTCTAVPMAWYVGYIEDYQVKFSHRKQLYPSQQHRFFLLLYGNKFWVWESNRKPFYFYNFFRRNRSTSYEIADVTSAIKSTMFVYTFYA